MAVAYRNGGSAAVTATRTVVIDKPSGVVDGDLLLLWLVTETSHGITLPGGWTQIGTTMVGGDVAVTLLWHVASSEPASYTFTEIFGVNEDGIAALVAYSGVDPTTPIDASAETTSAATSGPISGPSVDPTVNDCMIVQLIGCDANGALSATEDTSPDATERIDVQGTADVWAYVQDFLHVGAHTAVALDAALTGTLPDEFDHMQVALAPAAAAGPPAGSLMLLGVGR